MSPKEAFDAKPKAKTGPPLAKRHQRVLHSKISASGAVTLRVHSTLYRIGVGAAFKGVKVRRYVNDLHVRVVTFNGVLLRTCVIDPTRTYQRME